jgi:hypothetical protein
MQTIEDKLRKLITEISNPIRQNPPTSLKEAFEAYDNFISDENQHDLRNNIIHPGMDSFYNAFVAELDEQFKKEKDCVKTYKKEKQIKTAALEGLKAHAKRIQQNDMLDFIDEVESVVEQYEILAHWYDDEHITKHQSTEDVPKSFDELINEYLNDKSTKLGGLKSEFYSLRLAHVDGYLANLKRKAIRHYFGGFSLIDVSIYIKKDLERGGIEVENKVKWVKKDLFELIDAYENGILCLAKHGLRYVGHE